MVQRETGLTLARRCSCALTLRQLVGMMVDKVGPAMRQHPGPWRHLRTQVMRTDSNTRRPASDRRRVFFISEGTRERRQ